MSSNARHLVAVSRAHFFGRILSRLHDDVMVPNYEAGAAFAATGRLVYTERYITDGFTSDEALVTVTFVEQDGRTTLASTVLHQSVANRDSHLKAAEQGAAQVFDRLEEHLRTTA